MVPYFVLDLQVVLDLLENLEFYILSWNGKQSTFLLYCIEKGETLLVM